MSRKTYTVTIEPRPGALRALVIFNVVVWGGIVAVLWLAGGPGG